MPTAVKGTAAANLLLTALHCIGEVFWTKKEPCCSRRTAKVKEGQLTS